MSHILKMSEWESPNGRWHVADTNELAKGSSHWWLPMRMLGISVQEFITLLKDKYHASHFHFVDYGKDSQDNSLLLFTFDKYMDAHKYLLDMNRIARQKNFVIC